MCAAERDHIEAVADYHKVNQQASAAGRFNIMHARKSTGSASGASPRPKHRPRTSHHSAAVDGAEHPEDERHQMYVVARMGTGGRMAG